jgi:hypothetical protein
MKKDKAGRGRGGQRLIIKESSNKSREGENSPVPNPASLSSISVVIKVSDGVHIALASSVEGRAEYGGNAWPILDRTRISLAIIGSCGVMALLSVAVILLLWCWPW